MIFFCFSGGSSSRMIISKTIRKFVWSEWMSVSTKVLTCIFLLAVALRHFAYKKRLQGDSFTFCWSSWHGYIHVHVNKKGINQKVKIKCFKHSHKKHKVEMKISNIIIKSCRQSACESCAKTRTWKQNNYIKKAKSKVSSIHKKKKLQ